MRIEPLGEAAYILRYLPRPAHLVAERLESLAIPGVVEVTASYGSVGLYVAIGEFDERALDHLDLSDIPEPDSRRVHRIPVCYEMGEDLEAAAQALGIGAAELAREHAGREYLCSAVGFCPGFPYLGPLAERISGLARLDQPRLRVPPGSVAITGSQTGIYTMERPGGWWLIGRTPLALVDVEADYFPIRAGDHVQFEPIPVEDFERRRGRL